MCNLLYTRIDGGAFTDIFVSSVDEAVSQTYTMEGGAMPSLDDPMLMNSTLLDDEFQTLTESITGTGSTLTLRLVGSSDGGSEAFAARNIVVSGEIVASEPVCFAGEDFDGNVMRLISGFDPSSDNQDGGPGDFFGVGSQSAWPQAAGVPFSLADDSAFDYSGSGISPDDTEGVFGQNSDLDNDFFGISDSDEFGGGQTASWTFDVSGFENLELNIDMGGISNADFGGYNSSTDVVFTVQIDGGATQTAFDLNTVELADAGGFTTRPMDDGDPSGGGRLLEVTGDNTVKKFLAEDDSEATNTYLDKTPASGAGAGELDRFNTTIDGTGSTLVLTLTANFPFEAMAFDNISICGTESATGPCADGVIITQSFELETPASQYSNAATDGTALATDVVIDIANNAGQSPIESTAASAGTLSFDAFWINSRNDVGLSDGDFVGVTNFTGDVGAYTDGSQGYQVQDPDGAFLLVFDEVDVSAFASFTVSLDYFLNSTGWESNDVARIWIEDASGVLVDLLNTTGMDIDDLGIEGAFTNLSASLNTADISGSTIQLKVLLDSNSGSESLYIDNIIVEGFCDPIPPAFTINELRISSPGSSDNNSNYVEIFGEAGSSLDNLSLVVISGEFEPGQVDFAFDLTGITIDEDGLILIRNADLINEISQANPEANDLVDDFDFFGSPVTFLLVENFTGAQGDDLDSDNDGSFDASIGSDILDGVSLIDGDGTTDINYSTTVIGPDGNFVPAGVARIPNGTGSFIQLEFNSFCEDTPGSENIPGGLASFFTIPEIQGAGHVSPFVTLDFSSLPPNTFNITSDCPVATSGIVTAVSGNGFYMQDPVGDGEIATSDGIFVFTGSSPTVAVADEVEVTATVAEFFPGDTDTRNLPLTQLTNPSAINVVSSGNTLPAPVILGAAGRVLPTENIDDDAFGAFEPATDGIDFFETIEGMLVTIDDPIAVASTNRFGEIFSVADDGAGATGISSRGTLNVEPADFNPEKIQIDVNEGILPAFSIPMVDAGTKLENVTGIISYDFGNFQVEPTQPFGVREASTVTPEVTSIEGSFANLTVASYNVLNLDPNDADEADDMDFANGRFDAIAAQIVNNLNAPDIIGLQEVQDNSGAVDDGTTAADVTLQTLVDAISAAGGPTYDFIDNTFITNNASGGQPGGNICTAFLYNAARVDLVPGSVQPVGDQNPGSPFFDARLPLAADFLFNGETVSIVNNHFSSKSGSAPILGIEQDFTDRQEEVAVNGSLNERREQAQAVNDFVDAILSGDANAKIIVLGDLNEFEFISPLQILEGTVESVSNGEGISSTGESAILKNLVNDIPSLERYSLIFQGNSQALDHILITNNLESGNEFDMVHVNTEFGMMPQQASDHDPVIVGLDVPPTFVFAGNKDEVNSETENGLDLPLNETSEPADISDPCTCRNNTDVIANGTTTDDGLFDDEIVILSATSGDQWEIIEGATGTLPFETSADPDAQPSDLTRVAEGTLLNFVGSVDINGITRYIYSLPIIHKDNEGYNVILRETQDRYADLPIANQCFYPDPEFTNLAAAYCADESAFTISTSANGVDGTGELFLDDVSVATGDATIDFQIDPSSLSLGNHTVRFEFDAGSAGSDDPNDPGCQQAVEQSFVVEEVREADAGPDQMSCGQNPVNILATSNFDGQWSIVSGNGTFANGERTTTEKNTSYLPAASDEQTIVVLRWTTNGGRVCPAVSDDVEIEIVSQEGILAQNTNITIPNCEDQAPF